MRQKSNLAFEREVIGTKLFESDRKLCLNSELPPSLRSSILMQAQSDAAKTQIMTKFFPRNHPKVSDPQTTSTVSTMPTIDDQKATAPVSARPATLNSTSNISLEQPATQSYSSRRAKYASIVRDEQQTHQKDKLYSKDRSAREYLSAPRQQLNFMSSQVSGNGNNEAKKILDLKAHVEKMYHN
mmetsp:Transcript_1826/g.2631  ORF Transcript_1826/g.2631 Transcript_1826/m.2631 type:complete len:184 (-) Transcript_1826:758-1309(-)